MGTELYRVTAREVEGSHVTIDLWAPVGFPGTIKLEIEPVEVFKGAPRFDPITVDFREGAEAVDVRSARISRDITVTPGDQHGDWTAVATFYTSYGAEICTDEHTFSIP